MYSFFLNHKNFVENFFELPEGLVVPSHQYVVLCNNFQSLKSFYDVHDYWVKVEMELPNLLATEGTLFLLNKDGGVLTRFSYNDDFHNEYLDNENGVSLERTNWEDDFWTSGNSSKGGASIGVMNHSFNTLDIDDISLSLNEDYFSFTINNPVELSVKLPDGDYWGDVTLLSKNGSKVQELFSNYHFSTEGILVLPKFHTVSQVGVYIVLIEFRHPEYGDIRRKIPLAITE